MSDSSIRIQLLEPPNWLPTSYKDTDGGYSFDIDTDTVIAITRQMDDANTAGVLLQDTVRNFTLPNTEKNAALIGYIGNPNNFNFDHEKKIQVKILVGLYELPENSILVRKTGDQPYEIEAFGRAHTWITGLSELSINELNFGITDPYSWSMIDSLFQDNYIYSGINKPYFVPIVNYGQRINKSSIAVEDLRLWHSAFFILKEGFCKIGWTFNCPFLDSDYGRRLWIYILAEDYATRSISTNKGFYSILTLDTTVDILNPGGPPDGIIKFDNDSIAPAYDPGNYYNPLTGKYIGSNVKSDFFAVLEITGIATPNPNATPALVIFFEKFNSVSGIYTTYSFISTGELISGTYTYNLSAYDVYLTPNEEIKVIVLETGAFPSTVNKFKSRFWSTPKASVIGKGDLIDATIIIDPAYKVLDVLKGLAHLYNFKHETNTITKEVSFYPEEGGELYKEGNQEAFFRDNSKAILWTEKVKCESLEININLNKRKRNFLLEFENDSQDFLAKNIGFEFPLHSKNKDFGNSFKEGNEKSTNPFFAPTINAFDFDVATTNPITFELSAPYMPHILSAEKAQDGTLPKASTKIVPRLIICHRNQRLIVPVYGENSTERPGNFMSYDPSFFDPFRVVVFYCPGAQIYPKGFHGFKQLVISPEPILYLLDEEAAVYGTDEYNAELGGTYERFYLEALKSIYSVIPLEFLIKLGYLDFINFSHRDKVFISYKSTKLGEVNFFAKVSKVIDFVLNKTIATPILLIPNSNKLEFNCCECAIFIQGPIEVPPALDFNAIIVGSCGEIYSFKWVFTNLNILFNIGIAGLDDLETLKIGGASSPASWSFIIDLTIETECGTFIKSYQYQ